MKKRTSCGILCFRNTQVPEFLLMEHRDRLDFPKGHVDKGETHMQCALREWHEETGIDPASLKIVDGYHYETNYQCRYENKPDDLIDKTLILYAAWLCHDAEITVTEHLGFRWVPWNPPHSLQKQAIDPALDHAQTHWNLIVSATKG